MGAMAVMAYQAIVARTIDGIKSVTDNISRMFNMPEDRMPVYEMKSYATAVINANPEDVKTAKTGMQKALGEDRVADGLPQFR